MKLAYYLNRYYPLVPTTFVLLGVSLVLLKNVPVLTYGNTAYGALDPTNSKVQWDSLVYRVVVAYKRVALRRLQHGTVE
jgi:hypothetical protein